MDIPICNKQNTKHKNTKTQNTKHKTQNANYPFIDIEALKAKLLAGEDRASQLQRQNEIMRAALERHAVRTRCVFMRVRAHTSARECAFLSATLSLPTRCVFVRVHACVRALVSVHVCTNNKLVCTK